MKEMTYLELMESLLELTEEQLLQPVRVAVGRKLLPVYDTALSCECNAPARAEVGENYPLLIGNSQHSCVESPKQHCKACTQETAERKQG